MLNLRRHTHLFGFRARLYFSGSVHDNSEYVTFHRRAATRPAVNYWLVKQEPEAYSWASLVKEGGTAWTGVRNFQARNNLRAMKRGDLVLFYHSVTEKRVAGIARVSKTAYPDPTATEGDWSSVDLVPARALTKPVPLQAIKEDPKLRNIALLKQSRLSVMPLSKGEFERLLRLGETSKP